MRHIFVINPKAGREDIGKKLIEDLHSYDGKIDYETYITKSKGDAQVFVKEYLASHDDKETYRFYACGGDGTLYDVVNGAYGHPNAQIACFASGSGNDFIKNFHDDTRFRNLDKEINGTPTKIDLLKIGDRYCINITNYGFDGEVTYAQLKYKRRPLMNGPRAYKMAAVHCLFFKMNQYLKLVVDGKTLFDGVGLLAVFANGYCYGGGYHCAPEAKIDDGLMDVLLIKKVSRTKAAGFMKIFRSGQHLVSPKTKDIVIFERGKKATIESDKPVAYAIDGEVFRDKKIEVEMLEKAITFVVPQA